eukprot:TRINITY_DN3562_c0_g1_i2.p1 TRINITY_DN3562_c0_g1~~TRINITY_DN3562_c0_g1_i2.p1  ORF type:complete len:261 (+),score=13.26 TRINITY_DN3562_c0_g1_i2:230-1012(+)
MDLIPEVIEGFHDIETEVDAKIGVVLILVGYLLVVFIERGMFPHSHNLNFNHENEEDESNEVGMSHSKKSHTGFHDENRPLFQRDNSLISPNLISPLILLIVLSIHAILEGIVLGLSEHEDAAVSLLVALLAHKPVETLTLGVLMTSNQVHKSNYILFIVLLSIMSPLGVVIGMSVEGGVVSPAVTASLTALAAGSFLFISTTEIIAEEFSSSKDAKGRLLRCFFLVLGVLLIVLINSFVGHDHSHGGDNHDHDHDHDHR